MRSQTCFVAALLLLSLQAAARADRTAADFTGLKQGFYLKMKDADQVTVTVGKMHSTTTTPTTHKILELSSDLDSAAFTLSGTQWYYIYVKTPSSGVNPAAGDIIASTSAPSFVASKLGWYDPSNADRRCIGAVYVISGAIVPFVQAAQTFQLTDRELVARSGEFTAGAADPEEVTFSVPAFADVVIANHQIGTEGAPNGKTGRLSVRRNGDTGEGQRLANCQRQLSYRLSEVRYIPLDGNKQAQYWVAENDQGTTLGLQNVDITA
ncbi:MAG: hypothetical protein AB1486_07310 [Planctomycetota bacterium]